MTDAEEERAAVVAVAAVGAELRWIGGNCPVQAEGTVDGNAFYFRARGDEWQFHVAPSQPEIFDNDVFYMGQDYGEGPFDAGWMPVSEATTFIIEGIAEARDHLRTDHAGGGV